MSLKQAKLGGLVSCVLVGAVTVISCSSGGSGTVTGDGGVAMDGPSGVTHPDGNSGGSSGSSGGSGSSSGSGSDASSGDSGSSSSSGATPIDAGADASMYDGTVGKPCQSNADCQPLGGPGLNQCSTSIGFNGGALYTTGVCLQAGCSPATSTTTHFCDGPDNPSSPGVCLAAGGGSTICLPKCTVATDGSAPTGCLAKTTCNALEFATNPAGTAVTSAVGFCFHGCTADADCPAGNMCQLDQGLCLTALTPPTKTPGTPCTSADNTSGACNCVIFSQSADGGAGPGVCAPFCVSGPTSSCPTGFVCDALLQSSFNDGGIAGFASQNPGLGGNCFQKCGGATGGDAGDAGGACPTGTSCSSLDVVGQDCLPL